MGDSQPGDDSLSPATRRPAKVCRPSATGGSDQALRVSVLYTTHARTLAALKVVSQLGVRLDVRARILIFQVMPLDGRLVPPGYLEGRIQALARESPLRFAAQICLCRHSRESLRQFLPPHALIAIGGEKRWWPTREHLLATQLERDGHDVIFVDWG
jgi:hypothetical protein